MLYAEAQVSHRDLIFHTIIDAVNALIFESSEVQYGLPHGLAGNSAGVDTAAAHQLAPFDQGDSLPGLGPLNGGALPGRAGTDDDQIVPLHSGMSARFILPDLTGLAR